MAIGPIAATATDARQGSFKKNRQAVYKHVVNSKDGFALTLSGHSHRAAVYAATPAQDWWSQIGRGNMDTRGWVVPDEATSWPFDTKFAGKTAILVSGCGGPIAVQNHYDTSMLRSGKRREHLKGYGMDWPSAARVHFDGGVKLKRILPKDVPSAKPRFAVALDFFDLIEERVFEKFESGTGSGESERVFEVEINKNLPPQHFIHTMTLLAYVTGANGDGRWQSFPLNVKPNGASRPIAAFSLDTYMDLQEKILNTEAAPPTFLSTTFCSKRTDPPSELAKLTGYSQYNFDSPWLMRIEIKKRTRLGWDGPGRKLMELPGYVVERHGKHGEVPNFRWYKNNFRKLYPYNRKLPKSETADE